MTIKLGHKLLFIKLGHKLLFICTGNIFRSLTAEYALKGLIDRESHALVSSAGFENPPHETVPFVRSYLSGKGFDISGHVSTRLTEALIASADLAIAMGSEHQVRARKEFHRHIPMFSEVAYGTTEPLKDVFEVVTNWEEDLVAATEYGTWVMSYIVEGMPEFIRRYPEFVLPMAD